jgi:glycosyltransferase involved in cell wall biosynthesis
MPDTRRVVFLSHTARLGGAELFLNDLAQRLQGHCRVILFENGPLERLMYGNGIDVQVVEGLPGFQDLRRRGGVGFKAVRSLTSYVGAVSKLLRSGDILYANTQKALIVASIIGLSQRRRVYLHLHDLLTDRHFGLPQRRLTTVLASLVCDGVVANSRATLSAFVREGGNAAIASVAYNAFDPPLPAGSPGAGPRPDAALPTEIPKGTPVIACFSRLARWKGQHLLIRALAELPGTHLLIVGAALFGDDQAYEEELREQAARSAAADRIHFVGFVEDVAAYMARCDVVVHTSTAPEPFGRVIAEALVLGKPVVAARGGGASEILEDGRYGHLVDTADPAALIAALTRVLADLPAAQARAAQGGRAVLARYSGGNLVDAVAKVTGLRLTD